MRGQYEESPEQKARNELRLAARRYAGAYLTDMFGPKCSDAERMLEAASLSYAVATGYVKAERKPARKRARKNAAG